MGRTGMPRVGRSRTAVPRAGTSRPSDGSSRASRRYGRRCARRAGNRSGGRQRRGRGSGRAGECGSASARRRGVTGREPGVGMGASIRLRAVLVRGRTAAPHGGGAGGGKTGSCTHSADRGSRGHTPPAVRSARWRAARGGVCGGPGDSRADVRARRPSCCKCPWATGERSQWSCARGWLTTQRWLRNSSAGSAGRWFRSCPRADLGP